MPPDRCVKRNLTIEKNFAMHGDLCLSMLNLSTQVDSKCKRRLYA
jgi:hypothetical protein